ncbi:MAG: hypothetical protein JWR60_2542 [Polaromonas sp.]|nr:hypothetical protein [Polaromonas sp.]
MRLDQQPAKLPSKDSGLPIPAKGSRRAAFAGLVLCNGLGQVRCICRGCRQVRRAVVGPAIRILHRTAELLLDQVNPFVQEFTHGGAGHRLKPWALWTFLP